ncbi:MAG: PH domain-containing protein [Erythrobacter sp.]
MDTTATTPPLTPPATGPVAGPVTGPVTGHIASDDDALTQLDPAYVTSLRLGAVVTAIPFLIGAVVVENVLHSAGDGAFPLPFGVLIALVVFVALVFIVRLPMRRWQARGYNMSVDRLRVVRGIMWRSDTVVPFSRVQHIDVDQGPIERYLDIATLTLHTAGSHNASVHLPGLNHAVATQMREDIRQHIKRDTL